MDPLRRLTAAQRFALARQLRLNPTPGERYAWSLLRNRGILGLKFRRQHVLHGFIVDFYCMAERLVIELEGDVHDALDQRDYDLARCVFLEAAGYRMIRIRNRDVTRSRLEGLVREKLTTSPLVPLSRRERGTGGEDQTKPGERGTGGEDQRSAGKRGQGVRTKRTRELGSGVRGDEDSADSRRWSDCAVRYSRTERSRRARPVKTPAKPRG